MEPSARRKRKALPPTPKSPAEEQHDFLSGCTLDERANAVRFIRLTRSNYWLSNFATQILRMDADYPDEVTIDKVEGQLDRFRAIEDLVESIQRISKAPNSYFRDHPVVKAVLDEWDDVAEYQSDSKIRALIESAKKEPAK